MRMGSSATLFLFYHLRWLRLVNSIECPKGQAGTVFSQFVCFRRAQYIAQKMFFVFISCCVFVFVDSHLQQITLSPYIPPSEEVLLNKYFRSGMNETNETTRNNGKATENFYKSLGLFKDDLGKNMTNLKREFLEKNVSDSGSNGSKTVNDVVWTGLLKNLLRNSYETTTYRYPTATWSAEQHEKLKEYRRSQLKKMPKIFFMKPSLLLKPVLTTTEEKPVKPGITSKPKRGKIKWKDSRQKGTRGLNNRGLGKEEVDKFLEQSLFRYLVSSNLIENIGNVSVETFSEILRNITRQKADKRQFWPYDENKELRIKFRDEVFLKRRPESPPKEKFLEKQFQKRLERMKDYLNAKSKEQTLRNNKTADVEVQRPVIILESTENNSTETTPLLAMLPLDNITESTTIWTQLNVTEPTIITELSPQSEVTVINTAAPTITIKPVFEELKLSVAETVYYKKRPIPRTFPFEDGKSFSFI